MTIVKFYDPLFIPPGKLIYSVIAAKSDDKWIFARHQKRTTWEIAGGHIENEETPANAARRELMEETGAIDFILDCVSTYSVEKDGGTGYGRLFFAQVLRLGPIPGNSEIAEIKLSYHLPENLTYPDIQPLLFERILGYLKHRE